MGIGPKYFGHQKSGYKKLLFQKTFWSKEVLSTKIVTHKNYVPQIIGSQMFGKNQVSNGFDITDEDNSCHDICCLDKCHRESSPFSLCLKKLELENNKLSRPHFDLFWLVLEVWI